MDEGKQGVLDSLLYMVSSKLKYSFLEEGEKLQTLRKLRKLTRLGKFI